MILPMGKRKLLVVSDAVSASSGLARITRDLCLRIHEHLSDVYEIASFGYGGAGSSKYPWVQFTMEGMSEWVLPSLPEVVDDFSVFVGDMTICYIKIHPSVFE